MESLTTSQVADRASVNIATIRFYERKGLLAEPPRRASGYRQYPPDAVRQIKFIKHAQELGFSLSEVQELLALRIDKAGACADVRRRAETKIQDIEQKLTHLARLRTILQDLVTSCGDDAQQIDTSECPILAMLDSDEEWSDV